MEPSGRILVDALLAAVKGNPRVRGALRTLAEELIAALDADSGPIDAATPAPSVAGSAPLAASPPPATSEIATASSAEERGAEPLPVERHEVQLNVGGATLPVRVPAAEPEPAAVSRHGMVGPTVVQSPLPDWEMGEDQSDLSLVSDRCRLKSEACRWACQRRRRMADGEDYRTFGDGYRELVARAKSFPDCFLWMIPADAQLPPDEAMSVIAGCYDALADAADFALKLVGGDDGRSPLGEAFHLLAEAQSALRAALLPALDYRQDIDQGDTYRWLCRQTTERQIFITRHMKVDDPAAPEGWAAIRERVAQLRRAWEDRSKQSGERRKLLGKVRYQASRLARANGKSSDEDWRRLEEVVDQALGAGVPPSNIELRDALVPLAEAAPEQVFGSGMRLAMEEVDRYLSTAPRGEEPEPAEQQWGPEVRQVADLLRGKKVMLVGGERRPRAQAALEKAFELDELIWPTAGHHQSVYTFEADVAKPDVALVMMAIRWSSHSFGDLKELCVRYGKPFVRLPAGYNPNQVANAIWQQAGHELAR